MIFKDNCTLNSSVVKIFLSLSITYYIITSLERNTSSSKLYEILLQKITVLFTVQKWLQFDEQRALWTFEQVNSSIIMDETSSACEGWFLIVKLFK